MPQIQYRCLFAYPDSTNTRHTSLSFTTLCLSRRSHLAFTSHSLAAAVTRLSLSSVPTSPSSFIFSITYLRPKLLVGFVNLLKLVVPTSVKLSTAPMRTYKTHKCQPFIHNNIKHITLTTYNKRTANTCSWYFHSDLRCETVNSVMFCSRQ